MPPLVVGVDFGTLSGRAVVVRVHDGAELGSAVTPYPHAVLQRALPDGTPQRHRWVAQIITVTPGEREKGYAIQHVFRTDPDEREATAHVLDDSYRDLARWGFDLDGFYATARGATS